MYRRTCYDCLANRPCSEHRVNIYAKVPAWVERLRRGLLPVKDYTEEVKGR